MNNVLLIPLYFVTAVERIVLVDEYEKVVSTTRKFLDVLEKNGVRMNSISAKNRSSLNKSYLLRTIGSILATTTSTSTSASSNQMNLSRFSSNTNSSSTSVVGDNGIGIDMHTKHYWALVLLIIPVLTLFGNLLVICSVVRYRNLHSAINYFILGLAFADLMVALAVMPFAVYVEVSSIVDA